MSKPRSFYRDMTPEKAKRIRELYFTRKYKQWQIGEMYGIPQGSVSRIVSERSWSRS